MRHRVWHLWGWAIACLAIASGISAAQSVDDLYGRTVTSVRFDVEGRPDTSPALLALVDVAAGKPLTREDVRSSEDRLADRYDDVTPVATVTATGVDVTFKLIPRHPVNKLQVTGETGIPAGTLKDRIQQRYGGVPTGVRTADVESTAQQALIDAGYLGATVTSRTELQHAPEGATLVLLVNAGPLAHIAHVDVDAPALTAADVIARTHTEVGQPYRRRDIDTALTAIEDDLRRRGYYEVQATSNPTVSADGVTLKIVVDAGPLVKLQVKPPGSLPGSVDDLIPINRERSADQDLLEDSKNRIEQALKDEGYRTAQATFTRDLRQNGAELVVTFTIVRGPKYYVDRVVLPSGLSVPEMTIRSLIGVGPGDVLSEARFTTGLARVIQEYQRRGYYLAKAEPDYEPVTGAGNASEARVILHPNITEGPRGQIAGVSVVFQGAHQMSEAPLQSAMRSKVGQPYIDADAATDRDNLRTLYVNRGFESAAIGILPVVTNDGKDVSLTVTVNEGRQILVGDVTIVGNEHVLTSLIRQELRLTEGQPLGASALAEAQRRLNELGVFRRISITVEDLGAGETNARILVSVVELPRTTTGFGGGLEGRTVPRSVEGGGFEDKVEFSPRGFFEIGRRNLGGRNRSLDFFSRVSLRPTDAPNDPVHDGKGFGFSEYRVSTTYRERRAFQTDTDLLFGATAEQGVQTTFNFARRSLNAELLHRVSAHLNVSGRYALEFTRLFDERIDPNDQLFIDRLFPQVRLSIFSTGTSWDTRDSPLAPTRGAFFSADASAAARAVGSQVGYVKTFFQASAFHALDTHGKTVLAGRAEVGAAHGFPRTGVITDLTTGLPETTTIEELPASERFFAGGSTTVRGFQEDRLGVPGSTDPVTGLSKGVIDPVTGLSQGGNGAIVLNAEVRRVAFKLFGRTMWGVGFLDGGNVFANASDIDLGQIRGAAGFGVRYDSPLGPLRLDFGFKLDHQVSDDRAWEYHLSIGEAF